MKIEEAIKILDQSTRHVMTKQELKLKHRFSSMLQELKYKDFSPAQHELLEQELKNIFSDKDLCSDTSERELKEMHQQFIRSMRVNFDLIPEGYWTGNGMFIGLLGGLLVLIAAMSQIESTLNFYAPLGGLLIGVFLGSYYDRWFRKRGRTLVTKI
jgi:F0F1-type ATP synthase assembly protein I